MEKNCEQNLSMRLIHFTHTSDWSKEKVNSLDVEVNLQHGVLSTELFFNPNDKNQFLNPNSCHPFCYKKGMSYSQTLRLYFGFVPVIH